jgi:hypothetical protein
VYPGEAAALEAVLGMPDMPSVVVLFCHQERDAVFELLDGSGARPLAVAQAVPPT